ncbi:hypothetical protein Tco_1581074 [Tanacetum coccineum]
MAEGSIPGINPEGSRRIRGMLSLVDPAGVRGTQFHANHWQLSRWEEISWKLQIHAPPSQITKMPLDLELLLVDDQKRQECPLPHLGYITGRRLSFWGVRIL